MAIIAGFGVQVGLLAELRRLHRLQAATATAGGAGTAASAAGMIACCAHHVTEFAPFLVATGIAPFLLAWRVPLMAAGIAVTLAGIAVTAFHLRRARGHRCGH